MADLLPRSSDGVTDRWARVQTLFEHALERDADERSAWLRAECGDDPGLYREVELLLDGDRQDTSFLDLRAVGLVGEEAFHDALVPTRQGERVGPWILGDRIGTGGMGTVYRAERADDFEQTAALKRIKPGMDSEAVLARFRVERQILARLAHPGIARLLGGGLDAEGRPYFAMELVDGEPITDWCDDRQLSIDDRLALFARACDAVAYAHRQLVVHRDLKPSNVLVASGVERSGERGSGPGEEPARSPFHIPRPQVKLLDFGIARVLSETDDALTQVGQRVLTPGYAAPEQIRGEPPTTATDVYALGVLLYQLLSGARPVEPDPEIGALATSVPDGPPPRPATRVTAGAARQRGTTEAALARRLRGDLDTICLTALAAEPERRYGSAAELAADVRRHLDDLPIEARPATAGYRIGRFVRRHRTGVLGTAGAVAALIALVGFYTAQLAGERNRAESEAAKATEVSAFLASVLSGADPLDAVGDTLTAFDLLDRGAARVRSDLADQPDVQSEMLLVLGGVYENLGLYDTAEPLVRDALRLRRQLHGDRHVEVAEAQRELGGLLRAMGRTDDAAPLLREALDTHRRLGTDALGTARTMRTLGSLLRDQSEYDEAEALYREALALLEPSRGAADPDVTDIKNSLSVLLEAVGRFDEAIGVIGDVVETERAQPSPYPPLSGSLATLGGLLRETGDLDGAEDVAREALALDQEVFGDQHPRTATSLRNLGSILRDRDRYDEAASLYDEALRIRRASLGPDHPRVANLLNSLGLLEIDRGTPEDAIATYREALRIYEAQPDPNPSRVAPALHNLAELYVDLGQSAQAERLYRRSLATVRSAMAPGSADIAFPLVSLGTLLTQRGATSEAISLLEEAVEIRRASLPPDHRYTAQAERRLSDALAGAARTSDARMLLEESLRRLRQSGADDELVDAAQARLGRLAS
ncbi:MAG: serine/threonine-protein kinase [Bacteroidota bacterium]